MYKFPELIKEIRTEAELTQSGFAKSVGVSPVLIAMVESGQKEVSKNLLIKIADKLEVHPSSITPFLYGFDMKGRTEKDLTPIEKQLLVWGLKLQTQLIKKKSKNLLKNAAE